MARCGIWAVAAAVAVTLGGAKTAGAAVLAPPGFQERTISAAFTAPVAFAEAPDGRVFVAEKRGVVKVVDVGGTLAPQTVINISDHVNSYSDRGLLGIGVDRDFLDNGYVYLCYVFENNPVDPTGPKAARLTRITVRRTTPWPTCPPPKR